jgi:uncharacterized FlgJ-related protein
MQAHVRDRESEIKAQVVVPNLERISRKGSCYTNATNELYAPNRLGSFIPSYCSTIYNIKTGVTKA